MAKRKRNLVIAIAILTFVLIVALGVVEWIWHPTAYLYRTYRVRSVTVELPNCDRVELFRLDGSMDADAGSGFPISPYSKYSRILDHKSLAGEDAAAFVALWRSQMFEGSGVLTHDPGYGLRFYQRSSLIFETSVSFMCKNFYVTALGESHWTGFAPWTLEGDELRRRLQKIFPNSVPKLK